MRTALLLLVLACASAPAQPVSPFLRDHYRAADGTWVRRPHTYKRHPNTGTIPTGTCKDGSTTFAHNHTGACSHHGGVASWN